MTKQSLTKDSLTKDSLSLTKGNLPQTNLQGRLIEIVDELVEQGVTLEQARREFEKQFIVASIKSNEGNLGRSAQSLGVHRNTLRNKVCDLGIASEDYNARSKARARRLAVKASINGAGALGSLSVQSALNTKGPRRT